MYNIYIYIIRFFKKKQSSFKEGKVVYKKIQFCYIITDVIPHINTCILLRHKSS